MSDGGLTASRLTGPTYMKKWSNGAENKNVQRVNAWDVQDGVRLGNSTETNGNQYPHYAQFWTRRRGAITVVTWRGHSTNNSLIKQDLDVIQEMMIIKIEIKQKPRQHKASRS